MRKSFFLASALFLSIIAHGTPELREEPRKPAGCMKLKSKEPEETTIANLPYRDPIAECCENGGVFYRDSDGNETYCTALDDWDF